MLKALTSQDLIHALMIIWLMFACFSLTRYFFGVQANKSYLKNLRRKLFGDLAVSLIGLFLLIAVVKIFTELFG